MGRGRRNFGGFNPGWRSSDELTPGYFLAALSGRFPRGHPLVLGQSRGWAWRSEVERNELSNLCSATADRQDQTTSLAGVRLPNRVLAEPCRYLARNEPQANAAQVAALDSDTALINRRRYILHPRGVKFNSAAVVGDSAVRLVGGGDQLAGGGLVARSQALLLASGRVL